MNHILKQENAIIDKIKTGEYDFFSFESFFAEDTILLIKILIIFISFILNLLYIIAFIKNIVTNRNKKNNSLAYLLIINILIINFVLNFSFIINWVLHIKENFFQFKEKGFTHYVGGLLIGNIKNNYNSCITQGIFILFTSLCQDTLINIFFYYLNYSDVIESIKLKIILLIFGYCIPFLLTLIISITGNVGINDRYCYIKKFKLKEHGGYCLNEYFTSLILIVYIFRTTNLIISGFFLYEIIIYMVDGITDKDGASIIKTLLILITQIVIILSGIIYRVFSQIIDSHSALVIISEIYLYINTLGGIIYPLIFSLSNSTYESLFCDKRERYMTMVTEDDDLSNNNIPENYYSKDIEENIEKEKKNKRFSLVRFSETNNFDTSY